MEPQQQAPPAPAAAEVQVAASPNGSATAVAEKLPQQEMNSALSRKSPGQRKEVLAREIQNVVAQGFRIETQNDYQAIAVKGKPVNHVVHGIATLLTLGLWLVPWLIISIRGGEQRQMVSVDECGNVVVQKL